MPRPPDLRPDAQPRGPGHIQRLGRVLDRVLDAYGRVEGGAPADKALKAVFTRSKDLGSSERAEVGDAVFGIIRSRRRLEDRLRRAAKAERRDFDLLDAPVRQRMMLLAWLAEGGATLADLEAADRFAARRIPKLFERVVQGKLPPVKKRSPVEALAIELSLPTWMVIRLVDTFGEERARAIGEALGARAPVTLRVDPSRMTREEALERVRAEHVAEAQATTLSPHGIVLPHAVDLPAWPLYRDGVVDLQDEGSQLIALATGARPGMAILDACAGAGGKTLAIGALAGGGARLAALEPDKRKLSELKKRAARVDLSVESHVGALEALPDALREAFDVVLVDAPCTGTGTLRRAPDLAMRLDEPTLERDVARQKRLVASALFALKPGGVLIYATCSVLYEENEAITRYVEEAEPRLAPVALSEQWGDDLSAKLAATHEARIGPGPGERGPDGFYVSAFVRR